MGESRSSTSDTVCNGKGYWGLLENLLMLTTGESIVIGGDIFIQDALLLCLDEASLMLESLMLLGVQAVVTGRNLLLAK